jgi:hypothetical protein
MNRTIYDAWQALDQNIFPSMSTVTVTVTITTKNTRFNPPTKQKQKHFPSTTPQI